jgi:hypothetical protein
VSLETERQYGWSEADGWRVPSSCVLLDLRTLYSPFLHAMARFQALVSIDPSAIFAFRLMVPGSDDALEVRLEDAAPELTPRLRDRLRLWIDRQLARALEDLRQS